MSQRPATSGPESSSSQDGKRESFPQRSTQQLPPILDSSKFGLRKPTEYASNQGQNTLGTTQSTGPQTAQTSSSSTDQKPLYTIGMHNILNPSSVAGDQSPGRRPPQLGSPPPIIANALRYPLATVTQSPILRGILSITPPSMTSQPSTNSQEPRRVLTPMSPSNRAIKIGTFNLPTATIDAKHSPFISSRGEVYTPDSSALARSERSAAFTPPVHARPSYGFQMPSGPTPPGPRGGVVVSRGPRSQSDSPSTSYSSYSQLSHASPASQYNPLVTQPHSSSYYASNTTTTGSSDRQAQITLDSESSYGPVTSSLGQSTYQLMTLETENGPIQVPVDVQAASKMADEKRKRNAGASARFRQRRKEKEREASQTIQKLEHQISDIREEREHYRQERDYFRELVYSAPSKPQLTPRPPSPRLRNMAQTVDSVATSGTPWQGQEERGGQHGRNTRRRTNTYTPAYDLPPPVISPPNPSSGYASSPTFPLPNPDMRAPATGSRPTMPLPPPRTGPYDPSTRPSYDRSWNTGP